MGGLRKSVWRAGNARGLRQYPLVDPWERGGYSLCPTRGRVAKGCEFLQVLGQQTDTYAVVAPALFYGLAALVLLGAWSIVLSQNIVRMSFYLMTTLGGAAGFYFFLGAEFIGAVQLIVYVGGTLILIIFGIMLTSRNPFMQLRAATWEVFIGIGLGVVIGGLLIATTIWTKIESSNAPVTSGYGEVQRIGEALLTKYLVPFELAGVLLLVVMIGAAYLARKRAGTAD